MSPRTRHRHSHPIIEKGTNVTHPDSSSQAPRTTTDLLLAPAGSRTRKGSGLSAITLAGIIALLLAVSATTTAFAETCPNEAVREAQGSTGLPDCRAYELVSPADKNGGDIIGDSSHVHAAASEQGGLPMAVTFGAVSGFSDVRGIGALSEYMSERRGTPGTSGWATHAITPPQPPLSIAAAAGALGATYESNLSSDLEQGVMQAWAPLGGEGQNVAGVENLYLRSDLRSPGAGSYQLLSRCPLCDATSTPLPTLTNFQTKTMFAGVSDDFSHVLFESQSNLTANATGANFKLYEAVDGGVRLITGPGNEGCDAGDPCAAASQGVEAHYAPHVISTSGSRVVFVAPVAPGSDVGQDGTDTAAAKIFEFDDHNTGNTADDTTVQVNASELTDCAGDPTCGGDGTPDPVHITALPAKYWDASADDERVFFTTLEQLTDDTPAGTSSSHLYMWSATPDAQGHHLTLLDADHNPADPSGPAGGVIGVSDDGHYVYFTARGQIVNKAGLALGETSIYLWHDDGTAPEVDFIGYFAESGDEGGNLNPQWQIPKLARVTHDGKHLLFEASDGTGLTGYSHGVCGQDSHGIFNSNFTANGECSEAYVYSTDTHELACASCNPSGAPATANAFVTESGVFSSFAGRAGSSPQLNHPLSDDGKRVFFSTAEALVPEDVNHAVDVYEYDVPTHSVHLISSGTDAADSWFMDASTGGDDAFFVTRSRLVGWDNDQNYDLYDARINGGFPDPTAKKICAGDACQGQVLSPPGPLLPGSTSFIGGGNVKPAKPSSKPKSKPPCRHGLVRKRVKGKLKCVKPKRGAGHKARKPVRVKIRRNGK
jgi:hypothetical protein